MTNEDKKIVAEYMGWTPLILNNKAQVVIDDVRDVYFDLNDAGLIVKEMVKRGDWDSFSYFVFEKEGYDTYDKSVRLDFFPWLFNADNFFSALVKWRKER